MKKSFVYLIVVLMLATMLCACGADNKDGVIGASPRPTDAVDIIPSTEPYASSSMIPSVEPSASSSPEVKSPQVGTSEGAKTSPNVSDTGSGK